MNIARALFLLSVLSLTSGCSATWRSCKLYTFKTYKVMACDDNWAKDYCRSKCTIDDHGNPVNYYPRACAILNKRKPTIVVGRSYMDTLPHEICHIENPHNPAMCSEKYPARNDIP